MQTTSHLPSCSYRRGSAFRCILSRRPPYKLSPPLHHLQLRRVPDFNPPAAGYKRFVFPDGKGVYDGHWRGCKRHGQGSFAFANGDEYNGESNRCLRKGVTEATRVEYVMLYWNRRQFRHIEEHHVLDHFVSTLATVCKSKPFARENARTVHSTCLDTWTHLIFR